MPRRVEIEESAESVGGEKERYLASLAVSHRRIASAMERLAVVAEAGHALIAELTGDEGPGRIAAYAHSLKAAFDALPDDAAPPAPPAPAAA